ncbi:MAG: hypothetical protein CL561_03455 [Alphaproteobacteria bacterium]|nr:hypothetical protein [Alphaproteobacteria bacterium]|tara:strand:+ start:981 stop:1313 length:333 start_codon:yes stop_codon:yes gene_type:complete
MSKALSFKTVLACFVLSFAIAPMSFAQDIDPMDPWKEDRAAHQENIDAQYEKYQERWPEYYKERYKVDGVGVQDKEAKRKAYEEANAPVELSADEDSAADGENEETDAQE